MPDRAAPSTHAIGAIAALARREVVRFTRQPSRIVAAVATPLLLWIFLASGLSSVFARGDAPGDGANYALFLLPGMLTLVVLFSSIFAAISLIEDRKEGFLQAALMAPAPRFAIVAGKIVGSLPAMFVQTLPLLLAIPLTGARVSDVNWPALLGATLCVVLGVSSLSLAAAWWIDSVEGFHGVMNMLLMPMWLLSGAFFSAQGAAPWLRWIMAVNPLRYSTDSLRAAVTPGAATPALAWGVLLIFAFGCFVLACAVFNGRGRAYHRAT